MRPQGALALRSLPALLVGGALAAVLAASSLVVPGHRGGLRLADGFRPGRWDARFVVARGPAALAFPNGSGRATLLLSGPATVTLTGPETRRAVLGTDPTAVSLDVRGGGTWSVLADGTVRLHEVRLVREAAPPWRPVLLALAAALAGAAVGLVLRSGWGLALSVVLAGSVGLAAVAWDGFASLALGVFAVRFAPAVAVLALLAPFLLVLAFPRGAAAGRRDWRLPALAGVLAFVSCLFQVLRMPQPLLIGDPAAYHEIGGRFLAALREVRGPDGLADALQALRPYGGLFLTGLVYALLRGIHDAPTTIYVAQAMAAGGAVFFLTRSAERLGGRRLGVLAAALALSYATFPVICGIVQPEPFILLLWTWSLDLFLAAREAAARGGPATAPRALALAGLGFGLGLALHPQGLWFLLLAVLLLLLPFAGRLRDPALRPRALAFAVGVLPVALATAAGEGWSKPAAAVLEERHGFWAYTAPFPLGFWLFLDTDGWQGPLRIADTRYARGLARAEEAGEVRGASGRLAHTVRFVAANAPLAVRTVLRNAHRLYHVPDNPFRRDFLLPYAVQLRWHRVLVALFLLGVPLLAASRAAVVAVPFAMLLATYPLYHVFNKYAVPATPFVIVGAAVALSRIASERRPALLVALLVAGTGALTSPAALVFHGVSVPAAHALVLALHWGGLAAAFALAARDWAQGRLGRVLTAVAAAIALVPSVAAAWGDPSWRDYAVPLGEPVRHEIDLGAEALAEVDRAREAFLVLDLEVPGGDPSGLSLELESGEVVDGRELRPLMPPYGLATLRGGRDPRTLRQWWGLPWRPGLGADGRVVLSLRGPGGLRLHGDLDDRALLALSLGEWPHLSVYRLMHDGEYRLAAPRRLLGTRASSVAGRPLPGSLNVRLVVLEDDAPGAAWETAPASAATVVTGIWARVSPDTRADVKVPEGTFRVDLGAPASPLGSGEMRYLPTGDHEGWIVMRLRATRREPVRVEVRPFSEMSALPRFFRPEPRPAPPPLPLDWGGYPYAPPARILEAREAPGWRPAAVY